MSEDNKKEYAGVSKTAAALGQSQVDGLVATVGGAAVGAAAGAVLHSKEKHAVQTLEQLEKTGGVGAFVKGAWNNSMGRGSKAMVGAIAVGLAAGTVGNLVGLFRGAKKAGAAEEQFNQLTTENAALSEKLHTAEETLAKSKSFVEAVNAERSAKEQQPSAGAAR